MELDKFSSLKLKDIKKIDNYFEISSIEHKGSFLSRAVRRKVMDKIQELLSLVSNYLNPDSSLVQVHDAQALNDSERIKLVKILKDFAKLEKEYQILELTSNTQMDVIWIDNTLILYELHLDTIKSIINKIKNSYDAEEIKIDVNYLG
ncbi:MAG: hypothetical protein ACMXYG_01205 [Candidatus Woesearchaeota archaeon]